MDWIIGAYGVGGLAAAFLGAVMFCLGHAVGTARGRRLSRGKPIYSLRELDPRWEYEVLAKDSGGRFVILRSEKTGPVFIFLDSFEWLESGRKVRIHGPSYRLMAVS